MFTAKGVIKLEHDDVAREHEFFIVEDLDGKVETALAHIAAQHPGVVNLRVRRHFPKAQKVPTASTAAPVIAPATLSPSPAPTAAISPAPTTTDTTDSTTDAAAE